MTGKLPSDEELISTLNEWSQSLVVKDVTKLTEDFDSKVQGKSGLTTVCLLFY